MDFAFNASALAAGAVLERGLVTSTTMSLGSVVLNPSGGEGRTVVSNYFSDELVIEHAESKVSGRRFIQRHPASGKEELRFASWTSIIMRGVSIFGRVKVREMGTTISSTRGLENDDDQDFIISIWFRGVSINRRDVTVVVDEKLRQTKRYDELKTFLGNERSAAAMAKRVEGSGEELRSRWNERKHIRVSLVERIRGFDEETLATVPVPGLGVFRFGELLLKPGIRRVNLIRATFDAQGEDAQGRESVQPLEQVQANVQAMQTDVQADMQALESTESDEPPPTGPVKGSMILGSGEGNGTPIGP